MNIAQQCLQRGTGGNAVFQDYGKNNKDDRIKRFHQAIIPSYKLKCSDQMCGNITEWAADVHPTGHNHQVGGDHPYILDFQVWRPSPTVDDSTGTGCYSLVGNNRFTSIPLSDGLAIMTPSPQDYIQFQHGDVLGVYVDEHRDEDEGEDDGVVTLPSYSAELVWQAKITQSSATSQNGDCPYSVGSNGVLNTLTRAAPVISISAGIIMIIIIMMRMINS